MRNLRNIGRGIFRAPPSVSAITTSCWDAARDEVLIAYGPAADEARIELVRLSKDSTLPSSLQPRTIASWDAPSPNQDGTPDTIKSLHHCSDTLTTCALMAGGDIVTVTEDHDSGATPDEAHVEIVGTLEPSIAAARWSPDEELLVIVTGDAKAVFMSRGFDVITETAFSPDDLRMSKHVSVGWGKKETQFQGKGAKAKALRDPTIPEKVDEGAMSPNDDGRCSISWRGDGAYVAVNYLQEGTRRVIRVFNRDGELDSVSEPVDGLEGSLSWRPEGNLMAGIQRLPGRVDVVFFERNGLRHGQFTLRAPKAQPSALENLALEWNSDSTVLAVIMKDRVQLWTTGNYHWYLKQEVMCSPHQQHPPRLSWHAEKSLLFAAAMSDKVIYDEYALITARGPTAPPHDHGAVAVVDGQTIKFTPFRTANPPPPMAMFELEVDTPVIDVAFASDCSAMAVLHQAGVNLYALESKGPRLSCPRLLDSVTVRGEGSPSHDESPLQVAFAGQHEIYVLHGAEFDSKLLCYNLNNKSWQESDAGTIVTIFSSHEGAIQDGIVAQDHLGRLSAVSNGNITTLPSKFPSFLPWASFCTHDDRFLAFGLSRSGHLFANSRQLAKNCTSFVTTPSHLIFTTSNHLVKFVHLTGPEEGQ